MTDRVQIPLFDLDYDEREEAAVLEVLRSKWLTMGDRTLAFEAPSPSCTGSPLLRRRVELHSRPAPCRARARHRTGRRSDRPGPHLRRSRPRRLYEGAHAGLRRHLRPGRPHYRPRRRRREGTQRTRAIVVMHYGGYPCRMDEIAAVARDTRAGGHRGLRPCAGGDVSRTRSWDHRRCRLLLLLLEQERGCRRGRMIVVTGREDVAARARLMRSHGMTTPTLDRHRGHVWGYDVVETGFNYRLTEMEAALGLVQLARLRRTTTPAAVGHGVP